MNSIRRIAVLLSTATAVFVGGMLPADAQFSNSASAPTMAITAVDVLAPTGVSTAGTKCVTVWDPNTAVDPWQATLEGQTAYQVRAVIPELGHVIEALRTPVVSKALIYGAPALLAGWLILAIWRPAEDDDDEQDAEDAA